MVLCDFCFKLSGKIEANSQRFQQAFINMLIGQVFSYEYGHVTKVISLVWFYGTFFMIHISQNYVYIKNKHLVYIILRNRQINLHIAIQ